VAPPGSQTNSHSLSVIHNDIIPIGVRDTIARVNRVPYDDGVV